MNDAVADREAVLETRAVRESVSVRFEVTVLDRVRVRVSGSVSVADLLRESLCATVPLSVVDADKPAVVVPDAVDDSVAVRDTDSDDLDA